MELLHLLLLLSHSLALVSAQQVGSFFTAIYINGVPSSPSQVSCASMGQPNYCCSTGQTCAWDDAGHVACCESGTGCQGSPYSQGASEGQYYAPSTTTSYAQQQEQTQTTTVYQSNYGNVEPIVPVTEATVLQTPEEPTWTTTTSYYVMPTSTWYPLATTTVTPAVADEATTSVNENCPHGYSTFTEANVGAAVRTVGCQIIFNSGARRRKEGILQSLLLEVCGILGLVMGLV